MTAEASKVVTYAVVGTLGGAEVSKTVSYAVISPTPTIPSGSTANRTVRVWGYSLDGHDFYVVRLGATETLVYDLTTGQWAHWASPAVEYWRAHIGTNWIGMAAVTTQRNFNSDVVAGDDTTGTLWMLDSTAGVDDNDTTGTTPFTRKVTGGIPVRGRATVPCGAVELTMSLGEPVTSPANINLRTSDDLGHTWTDQGSVTVTPGDYEEVVEFRALGVIGQPGRIFEISDSGAAVRISGADMR